MSRLYKCDFCGNICEDPNEIYQLDSVPVTKMAYNGVDPLIGKHVCRDCIESLRNNVIRVVPGK